jgi:hypothetical protein
MCSKGFKNGFEPVGRVFESLRAHQINPIPLNAFVTASPYALWAVKSALPYSASCTVPFIEFPSATPVNVNDSDVP